MSDIVVSGRSNREARAEQEAAEMDRRLRGGYQTRPTESQMAARIRAVGTAADNSELDALIEVRDGVLHISSNNWEELKQKRDALIKIYDRTYQPNNGLQALGDDPNRKGKRINHAPSSWKDPNGRRLS
jgi:hypothetical protein